MSAPPVDQLRGFRIGVTSDRRSGDLIAALERRGAQVLHAPALKIAPNDQDDLLLAETRRVITSPPDVVLVTTGYGMRRWFEVADAAGLGAELTAVLEAATILARGPKAVGAVRAAGLLDSHSSDLDTTASLVDKLVELRLTDRRVALQLHGFTDERLLRRLHDASREVLPITPYRWVRPSVGDRLPRLVAAAAARQLDAVTFTSAPGAAATLDCATELGLRDELVAALCGPVMAAAVGPVTAEPLEAAGITPVVPERYRLGALIRLVSEQLGEHRVRRFRFDQGRRPVLLELRGRAVSVDGQPVTLGPHALAIFVALATRDGVVSRAQLISAVAAELDEHALEVAVSRLRKSLGLPGLIQTVVRRGYRLAAVAVA